MNLKATKVLCNFYDNTLHQEPMKGRLLITYMSILPFSKPFGKVKFSVPDDMCFLEVLLMQALIN